MKNLPWKITIMAVVVFAAGALLARGMHHKGETEEMMMHKYDPKTVETLEGEVLGTETVRSNCCSDMHGATHLTLKTDKETMMVFAGSAWYLGERVKIQKGDRITVTGSRITEDGKPAVIAREIKKGATVVMLRNADGTPAWRGAGMRVDAPNP